MRIGLNLLYMLPGIVGGTETYAAGLLHGLSLMESGDEFFVFMNVESSGWPIPEAGNFHRVICPVRAISRAERHMYEQSRFPRLARSYNLDVLHGLGYVIPLFYGRPSIVSVLDIVYDNPAPALRRVVLRFLVSRGASRANHILTLSQNSKSQIVSRLGVPQEKITVTYLAPKIRINGAEGDWEGLRAKLGIRGPYILALSSSSPHKNIPALMHAFARVTEGRKHRPQLMLAGHLPTKHPSLMDLAKSIGLEAHTVFTGYMEDRDLDLLYAHATAFVFPSLYEGFGLPVLEAMARGAPVACSNVASLPEVAGDAAIFFDPRSPDEIQSALRTFLDNTEARTMLIRRGYSNVSRFSWQRTAEETMAVYRAVATGRPVHPMPDQC